MSNSDDWFTRKAGEADISKLEQIHQAAVDKRESLKSYRSQAVAIEQQNISAREQAKRSLVSRLSIDEDSTTGQAINLGAMAVSGASKHVLGTIATLPINAFGVMEQMSVTDEEIAAYNRTGGAVNPTMMSEQDKAILNRKLGNTVGGPTVLDTIKSAQRARQMAAKVSNFFDISSIAHKGAQNDLTQALGERFNEGADKIKEGWDGLTNGEVLDGAGNILSGLGTLGGGAVDAVVNHTSGTADFVAENLPQVVVGAYGKAGAAALAASNVGYAADNYSKGVEEYTIANDHRLPDSGESARIGAYAATLAAAEQLGDKLTLGFGKGLTKEGKRQAIKNILGAGAKGFATEAATEGYQTFAEGQMQEYDSVMEDGERVAKVRGASGADIYTGAVIGGLAGGTISGMARTGTEIAAKGEKLVADQEKAAKFTEVFNKAVEENNADVFLDKDSENYNPEVAIGVLFQTAKAETATPEVKQANLAKASEIVESLEQEREALVGGNAPLIAQKESEIALYSERLETTDPADTKKIKTLENLIALAEQQIKEAQPESKEAAAELKKLDSTLAVARRQQNELSNLIDPVQADEIKTLVESVKTGEPEVATQAADRIINLSMTAPQSVDLDSVKKLVADTKNGLKPEQRETLRQFTETRVAENKLMTMGKVSATILTGDPKKGNLGIADYRKLIGTALKTGNRKAAERPLKLLSNFVKDHSLKAEMVTKALESGRVTQVVSKGNGVWEIVPVGTKPWTQKQMTDSGSVTVYPGNANSKALVKNIQKEAQVLAQSYAQLSASVAVKFSGAPAKAPVLSNNPLGNREGKPRPELNSGEKTGQAPTPTSKVEGNKNEQEEVQSPSTINNASSSSVPASPIAAKAAQATAPSSTTATEQQQPVEQPKTAQQGEASASTPVAEVVVASEGKVLKAFQNKDNTIAKHFNQPSKGEKGEKRPLAAVKDFISTLRAKQTRVGDFLNNEATDKQRSVIKDFIAKAESWNNIVKALIVKRPDADSKFSYNDVMQNFINEDGDFDENVKTAMSYAAYSAIAEMANGSLYNDQADINRILGFDKDALVDPEAWKIFGQVGSLESMTRNSLGQAFVAALGLKTTANTPVNILPQLEAAAGAYVVELMLNTGMVERVEIPRAQFDSYASSMKTMEEGTEFMNVDEVDKATAPKGNVSFLRVVREGKEAIAPAKMIGEQMKDTKGVLDKLFGNDSRTREPSLEPQEYDQKTVANGRMHVPSDLKKALQHQQSQGYKVSQPMYKLATMLSRESMLSIMGHKAAEKTLQKAKRHGQQAKNDGLVRELDRFLGFVGTTLTEAGLNKPIFFQHDAWKNQRVGIKTNEINPQSSKFHRQMLYKDGMETIIDINNVEQMNNLRLRVGEGLGVKVDKQANSVSLVNFEKKITQPEIEAALAALNSYLNGNTLTDEDQLAITQGVAKGGENTHTLSALMAWAQYQYALEQGEKSFTVQLMGEVDGVTNGPMLTHLLMGIGHSVDALFDMLNRGGFFQVGNEAEQYNIWRGVAGHLDLYEETTRKLMSEVKNLIKSGAMDTARLNSIYTFTGVLQDEAGNITKDGRNIIKTPLTALVFGSAVKRSVESMAETFVEGIYDRIQQLADGKKGVPERSEIIAALRNLGINLDEESTIDDLMEIEFSKKDINMLKQAFIETIGVATENTVKTHFATFLETRDTFNKTAQTAFNLYEATYKAVRADFVREEISAGNIEVNGVGEPVHDLTRAQETALDKRLAKVMPVLHTAMSSMNDELDAGLFMTSKGDRELNLTQAYSNEVRLNREGKKTTTVHGYSRRISGPGVAMFSASIHSSDSAIAHRAVRLVNALNVHDALSTGAGSIVEAGRAMNQATWEVSLNYSPATQVTNALLRTVEGVTDFIKNDPAGEAAKLAVAEMVKSVAQTMAQRVKKGETAITADKLIRTLATNAKMMANNADSIRLEVLSKTNVVSQYAIEGGSYMVSETERAEAAKRLKEYNYDFTTEQKEAVREFDKLINPVLNQVKTAETSELVEGEDAAVLKINTMQAMQMLNSGKNNEALSKGIRNQMSLVYGAMTQQKLDLSTAIRTALKPMDAANMVQLLNAQYEALDLNAWGEVGAPTLDSDPELLKMFEGQPDMTGGALIKRLKAMMKKDARNNQFNMVLLEQIEKVISPTLRVKFVTPTTPEDAVLEKAGADNSRGWYVSKGDAQAIYVLSPDYKHSGLTTELLMHELTHAALVHATMNAEGDAKALVDDLEMLRQAAKELDKSGKWADALIDVNELLAWGLNNRDFQKEVLTKINVKSQSWGNKLVQGMSGFIKTIVNFMFKDASNRRKEIAENGYAVLIANASGLFAQAAQNTKRSDTNKSMVNPVDDVMGMSTVDLYTQLYNHNGNEVDAEHDTHLRGLLGKLVQKLHGPFGSFKAELMERADLSGREILAEAMTSGLMPFGTDALNIGVTEQEAFVMEQVHATVSAALEDGGAQTGVVHRELLSLYEEMKGRLSPESFHGENATTIEKQEAKELYDFLFKIEANAEGKSDYLARFAAIGLASKEVRDTLQIKPQGRDTTPVDDDILTRLMSWFEKALGFISAKLTKTYPGMTAEDKLGTLVQQLIDMEVKRKRTMIQRQMRENPADAMMANVSENVRAKIVKFGESKFFDQSQNVFVKAAGAMTAVVAGDRLGLFAKHLNDLRNAEIDGRQGFLAGMLNEIRGATESSVVFHFLLRAAKRIEGVRKDIMTGTTKFVLESFADKGKNLTQAEKKAISAGVLRTDMGSLLKHFSVSELNVLVQNEKALDRAIKDFENRFGENKYRHFYMQQAHALGYHMATGDAREAFIYLNAGNIARMYETPYASRVTEAEAKAAEDIIDPLVSLYALKHVRSEDMTALRKVFKAEMARTDKGNGLEVTMKMHQQLLKESKEKLFDGSEVLFMKGYSSEIYNPYKSVVAATEEEGKILEAQGWVKGDPVVNDDEAVDQEERFLYTLRDGGMARRVSGTVSTTGMKARGARLHDGNISAHSDIGNFHLNQMNQMTAAKRKALMKMFRPNPNYDPAEANPGKQFMIPVFNADGRVANYRYMMKQSTKDRVLDRDNRFEQILGTMASSIFDKQTTKVQNREVIKALHQQYLSEYGSNPRGYVSIGPMVADREMREIYNLLPQDTKEAIREMFGKDEMMVRVDLLDINFGYRKLSWADGFEKDAQERDLLEQMMVTVTEYAFGMKAPLRVRQGQLWWQTVVQMTKDNMVVKSFSTLAGNFKSNISELLWFGVNPLDLIKHHRVAFRGALDYRRDSAELFDLEQKLLLDYRVADRAAMEKRVIVLKDSINRNPIKPLIDAGLMPTIVEDVDMEEDIYSYKTKFVRSTEKLTKHLNKHVVTAGKYVLITQDTPLYKVMSHGTQLSDFVARYTLYQHLMTDPKRTKSDAEIVQTVSEAFVNYDIPSHRRMQALNDDGFVWFTKYYLRIQKVIMMLMRDNPGKTMGMVGLEAYFSTLPTLLDSAATSKLGNNPMSTGALKFASTIDDTAVIKLLMSPFK